MTSPIYPCLWFDGKAQDAAELYCPLFPNSRIIDQNPIATEFVLNGSRFMALNGGPDFIPNPSVSFFVTCETAEEVDRLWNGLSAQGSVMMPLEKYEWSDRYGWVSDRFGISWQISLQKEGEPETRIMPMLMFTGPNAGKAEEAMIFYTNVFQDSAIQGIQRYTAVDEEVEGTVKMARFRIGETTFMAMDSSYNHGFSFNEAISFVVECDNQVEIDYFWDLLTEGGEESMCGWLKDRYGISWQIIPGILKQLMNDPEKGQRVMSAFLKMRKFDIETLLKA